MLAARWISSGESPLFTRKNLKDLLPETSAFLKDLFDKLVNSNFDKNLSWLLDDITSLLARTSVSQVFQDEKRDPSIHFYEDFLDAYDPQVRKDQGVYYTPDEVVSYIVRTAHASLQNDFGLPFGLADTTTWAGFAKAKNLKVPEGVDSKAPFVQVLDPALGTGTFLLRVIEVIHGTMQAEFKKQGLDDEAAKKAWVSYVRKDLLPRINGFELMMAPYIVSHLRLGLALQETGFTFTKNDRLRVFLTNTLEMHTPSQLSFIGEHVAEEAREADRVKKEAAISVIVGNPPYEREPAENAGNHKGGWVRSGWDGWRGGRALLEDFSEPTRNAGRGGDLKNIYNLYVYFWRWAMWRVFDRHKAPGIVSFITASSYLRGPGFSGMREEMRRGAERVFIFDLEGDQRGTRITDNVFCITIPVCVGSMVLATAPDRTAAATSSYKRITGTREEKLKAADAPRKFGDVAWSAAPSGWLDVLMAGGSAATSASYDTWPAATDIFPWQHSGAQFKRTWPIDCDVDVLERRWEALVSAPAAKRAELFRESRDRKVSGTYPALEADGDRLPSLQSLSKTASAPAVRRFGFRSFDRQYCFADTRVGDYVRPVLWMVASDRQVFITSLLANLIGAGPAATASAIVPDLHHFRGSYGGKDVIPLWRDAEASTANIAASFLAALTTAYGKAPNAEDIFAYAYAVLANPGYVCRYEEELQVPGPRLPVTKDKAIFERGAALDRERAYLNRTSRETNALPRPETLGDELLHHWWSLHVAGYARAGVATLDCIGAAIVGVLALEEDLLKTMLSRAVTRLDAIPRPATPLARLQLQFRRAFRRIDRKGPSGWRNWLEKTRHALAHRGRRIMPSHSQRATFVGANGSPITTLQLTPFLFAEPWKSELEVFRSRTYRPALHEDARVTMRGVLEALHTFSEDVAFELLRAWNARRAQPAAFPQPARQWASRPRYPKRFRGVTVPEPPAPRTTELHVSEDLHARLIAAGFGTRQRRNR
jgi:Type ISP C-terminal specificity domain